jgi:hypothetical protein
LPQKTPGPAIGLAKARIQICVPGLTTRYPWLTYQL